MIIIEGTAPRPKPGQGVLFLDRDGVINIDHGWVHHTKDFDWVPGIFELVKEAISANIPVIVVTNQGGIARGLYTEADFRTLTEWMLAEFSARGTSLLRVIACPHHPNGIAPELAIECNCRKPAPGMILKCISDFGIDARSSAFIGDNTTDIEAANKAGIEKTFFVKNCRLPTNKLFDSYRPFAIG